MTTKFSSGEDKDQAMRSLLRSSMRFVTGVGRSNDNLSDASSIRTDDEIISQEIEPYIPIHAKTGNEGIEEDHDEVLKQKTDPQEDEICENFEEGWNDEVSGGPSYDPHEDEIDEEQAAEEQIDDYHDEKEMFDNEPIYERLSDYLQDDEAPYSSAPTNLKRKRVVHDIEDIELEIKKTRLEREYRLKRLELEHEFDVEDMELQHERSRRSGE